jgi:hypothetical protein
MSKRIKQARQPSPEATPISLTTKSIKQRVNESIHTPTGLTAISRSNNNFPDNDNDNKQPLATAQRLKEEQQKQRVNESINTTGWTAISLKQWQQQQQPQQHQIK